jgi:hypothetical protein
LRSRCSECIKYTIAAEAASKDFSTNSEAFAYFSFVMMDNMQKQNPSEEAASFHKQQVPAMWRGVNQGVRQMYKTHEMRVREAVYMQQFAPKRRKICHIGPGAIVPTPPAPPAEGESEQALVAASAVAAAIVAAANAIVAPRSDNVTPVEAGAQVAASTITSTLREQEQRWAYKFEENNREIEALERKVQDTQVQYLPQSKAQITAMREMLYQKQQMEQRRQQIQLPLQQGPQRTSFDV